MTTGHSVRRHSLRGRLVAAFAVLVVAVAGLGVWSAWHLRQLGEVAERILADNYRSVDAAQQMRESLERLDADRRVATGNGPAGEAIESSAARADFEQALRVAAGNLTEPGEGDVVGAIRAGFAGYLAGDPSARHVDRLRADTARLLVMNRDAMQRKSDAAGVLARRSVVWSVVLALGLTSAGVLLTLAVAKSVVQPIEVMTAATTRIAAGDLDVTVPEDRHDELAQMARAFNHMAARLREVRGSDRDALAQARQVAERVMLLEDVRHLTEVSRLKSEFVAEASHELRTPLASLQLGLNLLLEPPAPLTARQREVLTLCRDDADRLARLTRDLLDLSRLETGARSPRPARVSLSLLVRDVLGPVQLLAESRGVTLATAVPDGSADVAADRAQIERVLTNLVTNAIRATPPKGRVEVVAETGERDVAVRVRDTGVGIPAEHLARIFEPFAQVPGGTPGGAGLGLSISRRIVEAHGGQLTVQSMPGVGSTFTVILPRAADVAQETGHEDTDR